MTLAKKILTLDALKRNIKRLRKQKKIIAFTNGCFDILHLGHVSYLQKAKKLNRILIVAINSDLSVKKLKGSHRPIFPQKQRAAILAALECVDYVTIFNELTPYKVIESLKPDILIKGADYKNKEVVGREAVERHGGKVEFIRYIPNCSTTKVIESIVSSAKERI